MSFGSRLLFAWGLFFRVLFDGQLAARLNRAESRASDPPQLDSAPDAEVSSEPEKAAGASPEELREAEHSGALRLLAMFQREGRLVDFLRQDVAAFDDADIGAAARVVHSGARKALSDHCELERCRSEDEGSTVTVAEGYDPAAVKLTGEVTGKPPFKGVLRHGGWRATSIKLPEVVGAHDAQVIAPAEVEL